MDLIIPLWVYGSEIYLDTDGVLLKNMSNDKIFLVTQHLDHYTLFF